MYEFKKVPKELIDWPVIHNTYDSTIYKTKEWYDYLYLWKEIEPFLVEVKRNNSVVGFFVGEIIKKIIRIIGSPFEGIGTAHQGLSMRMEVPGKERLLIYSELARWIFTNKYGVFLQVEDWQLSMQDCNAVGRECKVEEVDGYKIDLTLDESVLFHHLHPTSCRYRLNKSAREGVSVREVTNIDGFIRTYYDQLIEVFAKQGLKPTYGIDCVESLVKALYPDRILLLEAVSKEGDVLATGLFPGDQNLAVFWGGASYRRFQKLCPNEPLIWEAIKIWKRRGAKTFDMCGVRPYKLKFGPIVYTKPRLIYSKYPILIPIKELCKKCYYRLRKVF